MPLCQSDWKRYIQLSEKSYITLSIPCGGTCEGSSQKVWFSYVEDIYVYKTFVICQIKNEGRPTIPCLSNQPISLEYVYFFQPNFPQLPFSTILFILTHNSSRHNRNIGFVYYYPVLWFIICISILGPIRFNTFLSQQNHLYVQIILGSTGL